jgi:DNA-binding GntR family transcriptional regulator
MAEHTAYPGRPCEGSCRGLEGVAEQEQSEVSPLQIDLARQILDEARREGWKLGDRIPEQRLARRFGVSRSPVRGALLLLAERGLMRLEPGRGFILEADPSDMAGDDDLVPPSTAEQLHGTLLSDRALGRLPAEVSETELTERYGVSRGVVRRVFMRLAAEGLAERQRGHGWRFADSLDTPEAIAESYQFRLGVECVALRAPTFRAEPERLAQLRDAHRTVLDRPLAGMTRQTWFALNASFHETLAGWSHNRFFVQAVRQQNNLRRMKELAVFTSLDPDRVRQSCDEHLAILAAIEDGELGFAEALLRRHLELAGRLSVGRYTPD